MLQLRQVGYSYHNEGGKQVLNNVTQTFEPGKFYAIVGKSGAGKSTLLSLLAGLDEPTTGKVLFRGEDIAQGGFERHRREHVSLVFQSYNLIDYLTALENVRLVQPKAGVEVLEKLGISAEEAKRNVMQLSGGQQQRVAIARAMAADTPVILGDEPTGNLDEQMAAEIISILQKRAHEENKCVIVVTHSSQVVKGADVVLELAKKTLVPRS
ncbi:ABC transporter ATP-binding protein [Bifidobacterium eulemuris]|uniref:ABC transporter ATP-binding protein n=1 Tax=Bifidobacterium eulemuris TaxID=1765219 RepID=A0A261GDK9_9BIFI|nr:ABC transporter ATP-binding protein [Bifidobacterium eulemuris]OZG69056.1 multidrug ABC transporter ATP-binding protein [Bifidobacterium eulemuris]QOL31418.1 ABC transporter ATP-binding protein [Bifidobacterium eulemuris]